MSALSEMKCAPSRRDDPKLADAEIGQLLPQVPEWQVKEVDGEKRIERVFRFKDFAEALAFTDSIGAIAQEQDHHPLLITEWGRVTVDWWTHTVHGLHKNDFIMAAKTDQLFVSKNS